MRTWRTYPKGRQMKIFLVIVRGEGRENEKATLYVKLGSSAEEVSREAIEKAGQNDSIKIIEAEYSTKLQEILTIRGGRYD